MLITRHAFSLMEILLVVAIIAVLASLLLPAISGARAASRAVVCAANQRQLGLFFEAYASDHRDLYPPASMERLMRQDQGGWLDNDIPGEHGWTPHGEWWHCWAFYLEQYLVTGVAKYSSNHRTVLYQIYVCPSHPYQPKNPGAPDSIYEDFGIFSSYGINTACLGPNTSSWGAGWPGYNLGRPGLNDHHRRASLFANASHTIQLAEHWGVDLDGTQTNPHNRTWAKWTAPPNVTTPMVSANVLATVPAGFAPATPTDANSSAGQTTRIAHRGLSNYLFVDGHVERLNPWSTVGPTLDGSAENAMWTGTW
jgi:prepilin-type processing-associated H-X9-DG protein/prepilin-type N-terminal cleavage/methylation domain-containing protein